MVDKTTVLNWPVRETVQRTLDEWDWIVSAYSRPPFDRARVRRWVAQNKCANLTSFEIDTATDLVLRGFERKHILLLENAGI